MKHALVTGGAGFVGSHLADRLLLDGWRVTVVDNFDPFYDSTLKRRNIAAQLDEPRYRLVEADILALDDMRSRVAEDVDAIFHLAAKVGVRPSIHDPAGYQKVNERGTEHMLEFAREREVKQFVFASSSSVYGVNPNVPWREDDDALEPISPYASSKLIGELLGRRYSDLHGIRFIALRLFTVYGPRQRPDLAMCKLARLMLTGEPVPIYGDGASTRDYTFVDDIVKGLLAAASYDASAFELINLGNGRPVALLEMVGALEAVLGTSARLEFLPAQPGDVPRTCADVSKANRLLGYQPATQLEEGLRLFSQWLRAE